MNKIRVSLLVVTCLITGCSSLSALNPWHKEKTDEQKTVSVYEKNNVNHYLWEASLAKTARMPIITKDLEQGIIRSNWMVVNGVPDEKFRITVRFLGKELRADGLEVNVDEMKKIRGEWVEKQPNPYLAPEIEKIILKQASVLYRRAVAAGEE